MPSEEVRLELAVFSATGTSVHPLVPGRRLIIGRAEDADIRIDDPAISRRHAILHAGPPVEIEDLGSANGSFVTRAATRASGAPETAAEQSRVRVTRERLEAGDTVYFGPAMLVLRAVRAGARATPPTPPAASPLDGFDAVLRDPGMRRLYEEAARAAAMTLPVLVVGETGVGKDVLARFVHARSPRAKRPFIAINCAALSESLAESELFGHERGAFTGAQQARAGLFEAANGGTVFLDEVGELPPSLQAKLLRTLESSEVQRLGSVKTVKIDVRLVAATNRDLARASTQGRFRQDLYFRLNGITLHVPPLRERREEIGELAQRFLAASCKQAGLGAAPAISEEARRALEGYAWPGNVRELRYVMERALVTAAAGGPILPAHLPPQIVAEEATRREPTAGREQVIDALSKCDGHQGRAAELLGVSRRTLINRMIEFGLPRPRKG